MIQLTVIVAYLALLLLLGYGSSKLFRGTAKDYMLASHSIGPFLLLMSLFGTTMTAFALVGSTGKAYLLGVGVYGLLASASGIVHSACFFLIGVPLWSLGRRHGYTTQIEFFRDRLDNTAIGYLLFPILVFLVIGYLMVGVLAGGEVVQTVTGVPKQAASAVICGVVLTYVFYGGMRGAAWANAFQTSVFIVLGLVTFVVIANALGGTDNFFENLKIASQRVPADKLDRSHIAKPVFFSFLLIPLSVGMFPHIFQHWLTARSAATFKLPIVMHPILIMLVWLPCVLLGTWASAPESGIAAATEGLSPGAASNQVLGLLVQQNAGPWLAGLLTAGILAAIMSSLDSQFLCLGTMFTKDMLLRRDQEVAESQVVHAARVFVIGVVIATYVLSLVLPRSVFDLGLWSFSGFAGLFPLVFAAIYWRRLTATGAIASILATIVTWAILFVRADLGGNPRYGFPERPVALGDTTLIPSMHPVVTIFAVSTVVLVVVSLLTRPPGDKTLAKFFSQ